MPYVTFEWNVDGKPVEWLAPEHCVVLIGYDLNTEFVTISDPEKGIIQCRMSVIETLYEKMSRQAVVIKKRLKLICTHNCVRVEYKYY